MRLDHLSYVTSHDQLADTVQRIGALLGTGFVDGGIHPSFGTRNFTVALKNSQYIEVVCPLDHPATEQTPWGRAVSKKANEGGGWLTWVFSSGNIEPIASKFGRHAIEGHRVRPNGINLKWKQIGVKEIAEARELPFFIQWLSQEHPSLDGVPQAEITKIVIASDDQLEKSWFKAEIIHALKRIEVVWVDPGSNDGLAGIVEVQLKTPEKSITLD